MSGKQSRVNVLRRNAVLLSAAGGSLLLANMALATSFTWTRGGGNNNWDNAQNWAGGTAPPTVPSAEDTTDIVYSGTIAVAGTSTALRQDYTVNSIYVASDYNHGVGTSTMSLTSQSTLLSGATSAHLTILGGGFRSDHLDINVNITRNTANPGELIIGADQTWTTNAPQVEIGSKTVTITRFLVGDKTLTKDGPGILVLVQENTGFTGTINLVNGTIRTGGLTGDHNGHFGTGVIAHNAVTEAGITASTVNGSGGDRTFNNDFYLGNTGTFNVGGSFDLHFGPDSTITLLSDKTIDVGNTTQINGTVTGPFRLSKAGEGLLVLNTANSFNGLTVGEGMVQLMHAQALGNGTADVVVHSGGALELQDGMSIAGRSLSIAGTGAGVPEDPIAGLDPNAGAVRSRSGNNIWLKPVSVSAPDTLITVDAGSLDLPGGITDAAAAAPFNSVTIAGTGMLSTKHIRLGGLTINSGSTVKVSVNGGDDGVSRVGTLSISGGAAPTATLDLSDNDLIVDHDGASPLATITAQIISGRAGGAWNGAGINSSAAAANSATALGVAEASVVLGAGGGTFSGQSVDGTAVLVKYTYGGDSNLDGKVDVGDLGNLASNWQQPAPWTGGDFDYSGTVNVGDLGILATNWQQGVTTPTLGPSFAEALASLGLPGVSVPEPAVLGLLGLCLAGATTRRRR